MRKGWVTLFTLIIAMMMTSVCCAFELGAKLGLTNPLGSYEEVVADTGLALGCQMKKHATGPFYWGIHLGHSKFQGNKKAPNDGRFYVELRTIEIYPFIDFYPFQDHRASLFLRAGLGLNRWDTYYSLRGQWGEKESDSDLMAVLGVGINFLRAFEFLAIYNRSFAGDMDIEYINYTIGYNFNFSPKIEAQY